MALWANPTESFFLLPVVMFFLMMFYVFRDQFYALEHESD